MANIKIAELQSSLLEKVSATDLEAIHGGQGVQAVGSSTGAGLGISQGGGSTFVFVGSSSNFDGILGAFTVGFRTIAQSGSSPR